MEPQQIRHLFLADKWAYQTEFDLFLLQLLALGRFNNRRAVCEFAQLESISSETRQKTDLA